jgi:hypothetical protein
MANRRFIDFPIASTVGDNDIVLIWQDGLNKQTTKGTLIQGAPTSLEGLTDVDIAGLINGQILQYNSVTGKWENVDRTGLNLSELGDVSIVSPSNGQVLVYNSTTSKWENSSAGFVPYVGAVTTVDLGAQGLRAGYVRFNTSVVSVPNEQGLMYWDGDDETIAVILNGYIMKIGEDQFYPVKNQTGSSIAKGTAVRFAGTVGASGRLLIAPFIADGSVSSSFFMGVTAEAIANGADGKVLYFGRIRGINTNAFNEGDVLYASTTVAGGFQTAVPVAPNNIVQVAAVITKSINQGVIFIRPSFGSNINQDEGVKIVSPTTGQLLQLQANGLWENKTKAQVLGGTSSQFVKGDGSLDSTAYVPTSREVIAGAGLTGGGALTGNVTLSHADTSSQASVDNSNGNVIQDVTLDTYGHITALASTNLDNRYYTETEIDSTLTNYQLRSEKGQANGYASLDSNGKVPLVQINDALIGNVNFQGLWNAATNTPTLANPPASGTKGYYYIVSTAGTFAGISFEVGDWIISNGTAWGKVDNTDAVSSVFGRTGNVTATNGDYNTSQVTELTNLYYTEARVNANTNVAANTAARHNAVTLGTANGLSLSTQVLSLGLASGSTTGALSSANWTTFNNKENAITAGTTAQYFRGDKTFQTLNTGVVPESGNLYYTDARSRAALSFVAGSGAYNSTTGVITIPTNTSQLTNGANFITLASLSAGAGISYNNTTGVIASTITQYTDALARLAISLTTTGASGASTYNNTTGVLNVPNYTLAGLGGVPTSRTITINGTTQDLSANRTFNVGTVTSVGLSAPTGFSVANSPVTGAGTLALSFASGFSLPTNASQANWDAAYNDKINSAAVTGTTTKTLTLTQQDGGTITASWTDINTDAVTSVFGRIGAVVAANGDYTTAQVTESGNLYFTNARAIASVLTGYTSGAGTISAADSILSAIQKLNGNIGALTTGVSSVNGQTGVVVLTTTNIAEGTNLYYTEARVNANTNVAANTAARHAAVTLGTANGLSLSTQQLSLGLASAGVTGALSGTDWTTFNSKQQALNGTGFVKISGTTISYDNSTYYLASNPSAFIALTALSGTAPIQYNNTTGAISITQAGGSTNGFLSSTDWNTFNNKANSVVGGYLPLSGGTMTGVITTPNGTFGIIVGDDSRLADRNIANTLFLEGVQNNDRGYINFSQTTGNALGAINGGNLTWRGNVVWHAGNITPVSTSRTITINGTTQDLSDNRIYNVGTVTSVAALTLGTTGTDLSSSVANGTTTPVITLNVPTASAANRGALSAADWTTFNSKENAITAGTTAQYYRGDKTFQTLNTAAVPELTNLYYTEARVNANTNVAANTAARHNAVTLGTANGLSLSTQQLSLGLASSSANGALSSTDWTTFNNKQNALTNPVTGTGTTNFLPKFTGASTIGNSQIFDNGNGVGINTASPYTATNFTFVTTNNTSGSGYVTRVNGTLSALFYSSASSTIISEQRALPLIFETNGTPKLTLTSSGNLGLGVTPSAWGSSAYGGTTRVLELGQLGSSIGAGAGAIIIGNNWYSTNSAAIYSRTGFPATYYAQNTSSGQHQWFNAPSGTAGNAISFTQAMTLGSNSGLSIGTPSAAPAQGLLVQGAATFSSSVTATSLLTVTNTNSITLDNSTHAGENIFIRSSGLGAAINNLTSLLAFGKNDGSSLRSGAAIGGIQTTADADQIGISFYTSPSSASSQTLSEAMRITHSGNVGINTTSPELYYSGADNLVVSQASGEGGISIVTASNTTGALYFADGTSGDQQYRGGIAYVHSTDRLSFVSGGGNRASIFSNGNFLISSGTQTDAGFKLDVNGTGRFSTAFVLGAGPLPANTSTFINNFNNDLGVLIKKISTGTGDYLSIQDSTGASQFIVKSAGNVGIGTASPIRTLSLESSDIWLSLKRTSNREYLIGSGNQDSFRILDATAGFDRFTIASTGAATFSSSVTAGGTITNQTSGGDAILYAKNGTVTAILVANTTGELMGIGGTESNHPYIIRTGNAERMRITSTGAATFSSSVTAGNDIEVARTSANSRLLATANGVANIALGFNNSGVSQSGMDNNTGYVNVLQGYPLLFGTSSTERMRITSNGNVLIGTTSDVGGKLGIKSSGTNTAPLVIQRSANTNTLASILETSAGDASFNLRNAAGSANIQLLTNGASSLNGGNVLIGTSSDDTLNRLQVNGNAKVDGNILLGSSVSRFVGFGTGTENPYVQFAQNGSMLFNVETNDTYTFQRGGASFVTFTGNGIETFAGGITTVAPTGTNKENWRLGRALLATSSDPEDRWIRVQLGTRVYDILAIDRGLA